MTTRIKLNPAEGRLVRHPGPSYKALEAGESVEQNSYWLRKVAAGDAILVEDEAQAPAETEQPQASAKGVK